MSDITISVVTPPSTTINVGVDETTLINAGMGLPPHSVTHIGGGSDEINHNSLAGLQGGSGNEFYHLNSDQYFNLITGGGSFYPNSNPSGFITGVDLSNYATQSYVTGISGNLQTQISELNNSTGSYVFKTETGDFITTSQTGEFYASSNPSGFITGVDLSNYATESDVSNISGNLQFQITNLNNNTGLYVLDSETGQFYSSLNPSGFITGINNIVFTTGNQIISGSKTFTGSFNVSTHDAIIIRSTGTTHGIEIGGGYYNRIADGGFINEFGNDADENHFGDRAVSSNSFGGNANQNDFGAYATLNNYYGGSLIGQFNFDTAPTFTDTTGRDYFIVSSLGATEQKIPNSLVLRSSLGYSEFSQIIAKNNGYSTSYDADKITFLIDGDPPDIYTYYFPNESGTIALDSTAVMLNGNQTINGVKNFGSRPTVNSTGILLSGEATTQTYVTGISGGLQTQITTLNNSTGSYYPRTNPSGYTPTGYVTGISGSLQTQINTLNNSTGNYVLKTETGSFITNSQTGQFYPITNPSGFITGVDLSFSGNYYTKNESESRYVNTTGTETILGDKTFHDKVYINNLYVTGLETIVNTTNTNVASNYIMLNLTGGAVDGGIFFVTGSGLTGINDSGAIIGFDHSDKFKFGIGSRASDLSVLNTIAAYEEVTGISGGLQTQITTLNSQTGSFYPRTNPSGYASTSYVTGISGDLQIQISELNNSTGNYALKSETGSFITNNQTGQFYASSNPSGFITGIDLSSYATQVYVTGISGNLQTQISNLNNSTGFYALKAETGNFITTEQTGQFYSSSNPSGFITGIDNIVFTTGNQTIAGNKIFSNNVTHNGILKATAQSTLTGTVATDVINKDLLDSSFGEKGQCTYVQVNAIGGTQTTTQFAAQGSLSWGSAPISGSSMHVVLAPPNIIVHGNSVSNNTGGQGTLLDWRVNHAAIFPITTPYGSSTARDIEIRIYNGTCNLSNTNTRLGTLATNNSYGIVISKHPVNNTYIVRLVCRTTTAGSANITAATNASPIVITQNNHGLLTGDTVEILNVGGNTAANGIFTIQNVTTNTFELVGSTGNGAYTSGGAAHRMTSSSIEINPQTSYIFCLKWTFTTKTLSLHLGNLDQPAILSIDRVGVPFNVSAYQTAGIRIGYTSITDTTAFSNMSYGIPQIFKI